MTQKCDSIKIQLPYYMIIIYDLQNPIMMKQKSPCFKPFLNFTILIPVFKQVFEYLKALIFL